MRRKLFLLHEIYGVNDFIKEQALEYKDEHTEVECVVLYPNNKVFSYEKEQEAYTYFTNNIGFDKPIEKLTQQLQIAIGQYDEVVVVGFSVGATLAWRLSSVPLHRVVCIYGSRIRQYLDVQPCCPTLVLLPSYEKSFDVHDMKHALHHIHFVQTIQFAGEHGFMDCHNAAFHLESATQARTHIKKFL